MIKRILYFGNYNPEYSRNAIFIKGLKKNNVKVIEFNVKTFDIIKNLRFMVKNFKKLLSTDVDLILTYGLPPIQFLFAKFIAVIKNIPLINDIFISKLQTYYYDRGLYEKSKLPKFLYPPFLYIQDLLECSMSDLIILDTLSHIKFFHDKYNIPIRKFRKIIVGAQDDIFQPIEHNVKDGDCYRVGFWGTYIPLQGVQYIIKAANILKQSDDIKFIFIGNGQTYAKNRKLVEELKLENVSFIDIQPLQKLPALISSFDVGLGIFGKTPKTLQVIPNKVFHGIAMKIPMITGDTPAIKELFTMNEDIILCERANPVAIKDSILELRNNPELSEKIKEKAYKLYERYCTIDAIGKILIKYLNQFVKIVE